MYLLRWWSIKYCLLLNVLWKIMDHEVKMAIIFFIHGRESYEDLLR